MSEKMPHNQESPSIDPTLPDDILADTGLDLAYAANEAFDASRAARTEHQAQDRRFQALSDAAGALVGSNGEKKGSQAVALEKVERSQLLEQLTERERAIAENLEAQLPTSHAAYREHMKALGFSTELTLEAYEQLFTETLADWHSRGILDYLATDLEDNDNEPLLTPVPNKRVNLTAHWQAAMAFGEGQRYATEISENLWTDDLTRRQISGYMYGTVELRFRAVPSGYTKALGENTADEQCAILESLQRSPETSQLGLDDPSPLEAVASWYALRQQRGGGPLAGDGVFNRTYFHHVTLPKKRLQNGGYFAPASYVDIFGRPVLDGYFSNDWFMGRASVG